MILFKIEIYSEEYRRRGRAWGVIPLLLKFAFNNCKNLDSIAIAFPASWFECLGMPLNLLLNKAVFDPIGGFG
jgi:hypothetical protein